MAKIIKLTEKGLRSLVKKVLKESLENNNEIPNSNEDFDLNSIPIDVLDKGYVRYAPYNLGLTYRHPLRMVVEDIDYEHNIQEVKNIILDTYPIGPEQFIIKKGHNGMYAAILASLIEDNVNIIEDAMLKLGFFRSKPTDAQLLKDMKERVWIDIRFEPKDSANLTDYVRQNYKYVYHLAPSIFEESIRKNGLLPSNNNSEYRYYEPRVYLMKGSISQSDIQELVNELYTQAKNKGYKNLSQEYSLFTIDVGKINNNVKFYGDINEKEGIFITNKVNPSAIIKVSHINAQEFQ